ncbi:MAG: hypothetical protein GXO55_03595 [Chloroflexi bacterium]|nr:hypothetical protein [Chloroflexota bacterium]
MRVAVIGLGPIGSLIVQLVHQRKDMEIVAGMDIAADKVGKDVGRVVGLKTSFGISVVDDMRAVIKARPDVAVLSTTSYFPWLADQALPLLDNNIHVVTTCEEAVFPFKLYPVVSEEVDHVARSKSVAFLGVGVNPGFVMDYWPATAAALLPQVETVQVERRVNLSERRARLQEKLGAGLTPEEAEERLREKKLGHVGLNISAQLLAHALGWEIEEMNETVDILVADAPVPWHKGELEPGKVKGLRQVLTAQVGGESRIRLTLEMALGLSDPGDKTDLGGSMPLHVELSPISGDWATASIVVNALPRVMRATPGLRTVLDIPPLVGNGV